MKLSTKIVDNFIEPKTVASFTSTKTETASPHPFSQEIDITPKIP
jgi:hypothetical protein